MRQCPYRCAIRAGLNLPDKEFRYLRTVIVTAAVYWGFGSKLAPQPLTFQHWAGVSPYTSTCVLAETCVFDKQSHGLISCGPTAASRHNHSQHLKIRLQMILKSICFVWNLELCHKVAAGQGLSRSYARYIAEFLNEGSPETPEATRLDHLCRLSVRVPLP